jgi:hypothetical protein
MLGGTNKVLFRKQNFISLRKSLRRWRDRVSEACCTEAYRTKPVQTKGAFEMAGYSGTPLIKKLGIKAGAKIILINQPANYLKLLGVLPEKTAFSHRIRHGCDFVHLFTTRRAELEERMITLRANLADTGTVWVSWPKKSAGVTTDITEDVIRQVALPLGFVDTKVCAVDDTWSGLKLMVRRENRTPRTK